MASKTILAVLVILLAIPLAVSEPQFIISVSDTVDNPFEVAVGVNETVSNFRGLDFTVKEHSGTRLVNVYKVSSSSAVHASYDENHVALVSEDPITLSQNFVILEFEVLAAAGEVTIRAEQGQYALEDGETSFPIISSEIKQVTLSSCVLYENTHSNNDGNPVLPGTSCFCNSGYLPTIGSSGWSCKSTQSNIYGNKSQACSLGGDPIYGTGFCCRDGYHVNPQLTADNFATMFGQGVEVCVVKPNEVPVAKIYSPEDDEAYTVGTRIRFNAKDSFDPDEGVGKCTDCTYEWDFGDKSSPWGKLQFDADDDIICKSRTSSKKCDEDEAEVEGDVDTDSPDNPCTCPEYEEHIYPLQSGKIKYYTYSDEFACTEYGEDATNECKVTLYVTDSQNATGKTSIEIDLDDSLTGGDSDDGEMPFCGDSVIEGAEECDGTPTIYCDSGVCNADCTCYEIEQIPVVERPTQAVCGNMRCEATETATNCMVDCHCGDGTCQAEYGVTDENCTDCGKESHSFWLIALISLIIIGGFLFAMKMGIISLDKILPGLATSVTGKSGSEILDNMAVQHNVHRPYTGGDASLSRYIQSTRAKGYSYSQIKDTLAKKGWREDKINEVFSKLNP